jgi:hypothetical protein
MIFVCVQCVQTCVSLEEQFTTVCVYGDVSWR